VSHDDDIPARKKPRPEEPLPTTTDEASRKTAAPDISSGFPSAVADNNIINADPIVTDTQPNGGATRVTGSWTLEEDAKLTSAVKNNSKKRWGKDYKTNWDAVTALVPGRTQT
jgi:hypothetical protein